MVDITRIMQYEAGETTFQDIIEMFQEMINDGTVWQLQGHYGRTAMALIEAGDCTPTGQEVV